MVDIISGTSAGGINGVLLALALARQKDFRLSAQLWREVADIDELLREEKSFEGLPEATPRDSESLLNGYRLYFKAREAMEQMPAESPDDPWRPAFVEQLDLAVTATDLDGVPLPVRLTEQRSIDERVHRKVFRFSYGTAATTGEQHSDFEDLDLLLGFAARATSSFPMAFEPVLFEGPRGAGATGRRPAGRALLRRRQPPPAGGRVRRRRLSRQQAVQLRHRGAAEPARRRARDAQADLHRAASGQGGRRASAADTTSAAASAIGPT